MLFAFVAAVGCAVATNEETPVDPNEPGSGGAAGSGLGGVSNGGVSTGGVSTGGVSTGGVSTGGVSTGGTGAGQGGTGGRGGTSGMSGAAGRGGSAFGGAAGMGGGSSGTGGRAGASGGGGRGGGSGGGGRGGAGGSGTTGACPNPRMPDQAGNSGSFMTTMAVCYEVTASFNAWMCSNIGTRTVAVNGTPVECGEVPLPPRIDGAYYFEFSAGTPDYTSFFWFTQ